MKKLIPVLIGIMLFQSSNLLSEVVSTGTDPSQKASINVLSSPELYNLVTKWAGEYQSQYPGQVIRVSSSGSQEISHFAGTGADLAITAGDPVRSIEGTDLWKMAVGRDVVVPVINSENPFLEELYLVGVTQDKFARITGDQGQRVWGTIIEKGQSNPIHLYILDDETSIAAVKKFLAIDQLPAEGIYFNNADEIIAAVQHDPLAIGFCKLVNILNPDQPGMVGNIRLLPIDKNSNGRIDYMEKIYDSPDAFARGVWIGKYPRALYSDIYLVAAAQPQHQADIAFIKWVLTEGQQFLSPGGLSNLVFSERQSKLAKLDQVNIIQPSSENFYFLTPLVFIILAALIFLSLAISVVLYYRKNRQAPAVTGEKALPVQFTTNSVDIPKGLYYDKTHTWAFREKDGTVKIGIDDFLQHVTGPVTGIEMRKPGEKIRKGDMILSIIQHGKRLIISAPLSGTIVEQNKLLQTHVSKINSSPYSDGWVYRMEPANWFREIQFLEIAESYKSWLSGEFTRLKDFLAVSLKVDKAEYEHVVLQDGGILKDNILEEFGPQVWEDFQVNFLDTDKKMDHHK